MEIEPHNWDGWDLGADRKAGPLAKAQATWEDGCAFTEEKIPGGARGVGDEFGLVATRIEVPGEKAVQRCVAHPNLDSSTFESLEGSGQMP